MNKFNYSFWVLLLPTLLSACAFRSVLSPSQLSGTVENGIYKSAVGDFSLRILPRCSIVDGADGVTFTHFGGEQQVSINTQPYDGSKLDGQRQGSLKRLIEVHYHSNFKIIQEDFFQDVQTGTISIVYAYGTTEVTTLPRLSVAAFSTSTRAYLVRFEDKKRENKPSRNDQIEYLKDSLLNVVKSVEINQAF